MSALSIRNMNISMGKKELETTHDDSPRVDWFDWRVSRKSKRGSKNDVTVAILNGYTKKEFAEWWNRNARPGYKARVWFNPQAPLNISRANEERSVE